MATVYLARDLRQERLVALKVLRPELSASLGSERFLREIKLAPSCSTRICTVYPLDQVVETHSVAATRIVGNMFLPVSREKTEPIAGRIIEVPEDVEQTELYRNPRSGFIAYVPPGSIEKGADLVTKRGSSSTCHGPDLRGLADVPPIAGRSPSYIVRQLWDIGEGTRNGAAAQVMKPVVANLTGDDLVAIAAYVSSR
jgi:cytochrome c553